MLRLENISKSYNKVKVLKNINISFRKHELVAILGPSGCGKTTLLNIIGALEIADEGRILLGHHDISTLKNEKLDQYRSNHINYIFQNYNLINHINVMDNITLNCKLKNEPFYKREIRKLLGYLRLSGLEKKHPHQLSGGEKQRVAIIRSLINDSPILLADEPTGALDSKTADEVMQILQIISQKKLVIMVTHNERSAKKYASRIIYLKDGQIKNDSKPNENIFNIKFDQLRTKLKYLTAFKLSFNNLKNKKIRTFLTVLAFSIGLISLALILSISNGFRNEIRTLEQEGLYNYPLIISRKRVNPDYVFDFSNQEYQSGIINVKSNNIVRNVINQNLFNLINSMDRNLINGIAIYRDGPTLFRNMSYVIPSNNFFNLLAGKFPIEDEEVLLLLDQDFKIDEWIANYLNINEVPFNEIINKRIEFDDLNLEIVGVVQSNINYFSNLNGILYNSNLFNTEVSDVYFFASSYENKQKIKEIFQDYYIIDEAKLVINVTNNLVDGISLILIIFSMISLMVSVIMIAIISYISVLERQKEIGLLKAMGTSKRDVRKLFLAENMIIGIFSSAISLEIVRRVSILANKYIAEYINIQNMVNLDLQIVMIIILLSIFLTYFAGLIPAKIASKKRIVDILYGE